MPQRLAIALAAVSAGLLLAACATGGAPSFADSGPAASAAPAPALPPGPILAASGNAVLPIYDLGGRLVSPSLPGLPQTGLQAQLTPGGATLGAQAGPLSTGVALTSPLRTSPSLVLPVDLGGGLLVSPGPAAVGPALAPVLGPNGLMPGLLRPLPIGRP